MPRSHSTSSAARSIAISDAQRLKRAFDYILAHRDRFPYLTTLEDVRFTPTWLHFDTRNHNQQGIWIVRP